MPTTTILVAAVRAHSHWEKKKFTTGPTTMGRAQPRWSKWPAYWRRAKKLPRRVVFIAFTGEERGLIGSARYCREPLFPLDKTVAMLNMDMVGRLKDDKLIIQGLDTATEFTSVIDRLNEGCGFDLAKKDGGTGPSDHSSFYLHKIPVMHFFTGLHSDYHRPSDDVEKINVPGMRRVAELVADTAVAIAEGDGRPTYVEKATPPAAGGGEGGIGRTSVVFPISVRSGLVTPLAE